SFVSKKTVQQVIHLVAQSHSHLEPLFRLAGYTLLSLFLLDLLAILIPFNFTNSVWEFQLANQLVERAPVPILGLIFVLIGESQFRFFKFLSWLSLLGGILYFLLLPLAISAIVRIDQQSSTQIATRSAQIQQLKEQINKAQTSADIAAILSRINPQATPPEIGNPEVVKQQLLASLSQNERSLQAQAASRENNLGTQIKNTIKISLGALISGTFFLVIWQKTRKIVNQSQFGS
ncbi:HpsJ family protein, partial [Chroococcidiopsis cubana]